MKTFARRLKQARQKAGYSSAQRFAAAAGIEAHTYRKYERGAAEANYETLVRMCELLGISTSDLLPVSTNHQQSDGGKAAAA